MTEHRIGADVRKILNVLVEQKDIRVEGRVGAVVVYGIHEGLYPDMGKFLLSLEASLDGPKVLRGDGEMSIHRLRDGLYILLVPVSGPDVPFTITVAPAGGTD